MSKLTYTNELPPLDKFQKALTDITHPAAPEEQGKLSLPDIGEEYVFLNTDRFRGLLSKYRDGGDGAEARRV